MHDITGRPARSTKLWKRWPFARSTRAEAVGNSSEYATYLGKRWSEAVGELPDYDLPDDVVGGPLPDDVAAPPSKGKGKWWWFSRGLGLATLLFIILLVWLALTAPLSKSLQPIVPPQITLTASDGTPIARNGAITDKPVQLAKLPPHVANAFLAIEDRRFYSHLGVDPRGIARAALNNVTGGSTQGGSTITQQLAKFTFLSSDRTITRKARELLIAFWLEARLSKEEILERYLSNVYFGDNVYGLRAASLHYFYRQPERLKPEQAMMLAGLVQAPSRLAPTRNLAGARKRAALVRRSMVAAGFLSEAEAKRLPTAKIDVRRRSSLPTGTYFADWAMPEARRVASGGYGEQTFQTTLDARLQNAARAAIAQNNLGNAEVALVAMKPTGEVVAMIGGRSYAKSPFNRATQAKRQPGSTFKLFVWLAALQSGMRPESIVDDSPIETGNYRPKNAGESYAGKISLKQAFAKSSNVAAVRLLGQVGDDNVRNLARNFGISSQMGRDDPSLALGTSTMTLLELTSAYAGVAANSYPVRARAFAAEEKGWFDWLVSPERSLSSSVHTDMEEMLRYAVNSGTGRNAQLNIANFGKTGTSQDNRDAIFVGYAGGLVVGVWVGNDDNTPLKGIHGGTVPARIWKGFMQRALTSARPVAPRPPKKPRTVDQQPVEPLDLPELPDVPDIPVDIRKPEIEVDPETGVILRTEIEGVPLDVNIGRDGVDIRQRESANPKR